MPIEIKINNGTVVRYPSPEWSFAVARFMLGDIVECQRQPEKEQKDTFAFDKLKDIVEGR
jgi:hypothetical protein